MLTPRHCAAIDLFIKDECQKNILAYDGPLDVVVDIGAHIGFFTYAALNKGAREVWSFEPTPINFEKLVANVLDDGLLGQVTPLPLAIGGDRRYATLGRAGRNNGQHGILMAPKLAGPHVARVIPLSALLSLLPDRIDYLKIDIEGAEFLAFDDVDSVDALLSRVGYLELSLHEASTAIDYSGPDFPSRFRSDPFGTIHEIVKAFGFTEANDDVVRKTRMIASRNLRGVSK